MVKQDIELMFHVFYIVKMEWNIMLVEWYTLVSLKIVESKKTEENNITNFCTDKIIPNLHLKPNSYITYIIIEESFIGN